MFKSFVNSIKNFINFQKKTNMEKEIFEQPEIIKKLIRKYIKVNYNIDIQIPEKVDNAVLIASGSSYHSAIIVANFLNSQINFCARACYSSEICIDKNFKVDENTLYIFISQSGETSDTNKALKLIAEKTSNTFAITNSKNSELHTTATYKMLINAGTEKAIASTKTMGAQTFCLFLVALKILEAKDIKIKKFIESLVKVPQVIEDLLQRDKEICSCAKSFAHNENIIILANSIFYCLAREGVLKLQETTYINSCSSPMGEFLHGHMALLNKKSVVISIINEDNIDLAVSVHAKMKGKYNYNNVIISNIPTPAIKYNSSLMVNCDNDLSYLFAVLVIIQLFSFTISKTLNHNIDTPEGLSKVV